MDEISFQLPVASYDTLIHIILGYYGVGAGDEPVTAATVAEVTAMKAPNVSGNNKFLQSVGILERTGKGYQLSADGLELARCLDYDKESEASETRSAWGKIIDGSDFLGRMTTAVRLRENMDSDALVRHIALTSGAPNKPRFLSGARAVITMLQAADRLVEKEDGTLEATERGVIGASVSDMPSGIIVQERVVDRGWAAGVSVGNIPVLMMVQVTVETSDGELEELARKIKYLSRLVNSTDLAREEDVEAS
jgi:hypothetical protein